jgi:8-amino-7-oxononanoate synthase
LLSGYTPVIDPLAWIDAESGAWNQRGLARRLVVRGAHLVNFGSNDYLGLAADPRLAQAARDAAESYGWGAGASPLLSGWTEAHQRLVEALADFEQVEAVALFASGYAAGVGTIASLVGPDDVIYSDRLNHACLIDGARLSGARVRVYAHCDLEQLELLLKRDAEGAQTDRAGRLRRRLIITNGVFSMDGDLAPLAGLVALSERYGAMLLVDEAHGTGVFGPGGRGAAEASGVADRVHVRVGTLSKALGSLGGFVAGSRRLIDWLTNHARTLIYSTALPPAAAAAAGAALAIAREEPWRRERLVELGRRLVAEVAAAGFSSGPLRTEGPIVPVLLGSPARALAASEELRRRGLYVPAIRPPTVPEGTARLRVSLSAAHRDEDLDRLIATLHHLAV